MKEEQVLLVWELNPESVQFYLFDIESYGAQLAKYSSGFMINGDDLPDNPSIFKLNEFLNTIKPASLEELKCSQNITSVFHAGFFL